MAQETSDSNSYNECLAVGAVEQSLFLRSFGVARFRSADNERLTHEGAAELYWGILIDPLQHD